MKQTSRIAAIFAIAVHATAALGAEKAAAEPSQDPGWSVRLTGAPLQSTAGGGFDTSLGYGLGVGYRASRRLGVELGVVSGEIDNEIGFDFFDQVSFSIGSSLRAMPILAQLDVHLTPDSRVDLYLGPVVGYVTYGDLETRVRTSFGDDEQEIPVLRVGTRDGFAWGAHLGLDVPLGQSRSFLTFGVTYLQAEVETEGDFDDTGRASFDLDPLLLQAGFGWRF